MEGLAGVILPFGREARAMASDYEILGISPCASREEVRAAYRALARGRDVLMFENEWSIRLACENNEGLVLAETADRMTADDLV